MSLRHYPPTPTSAGTDADGSGSRRRPRNGRGGRDSRGSGLTARFREQPILNGFLLLLCVAAIVLAVTAIGTASPSSGQTTRTATAKQGVVQSTVSGSGNVQSANELDLGFKTSGTVTDIYVKQGQHVVKGQLLATLDPETTEVTLEQAKATLQAAEANLAQLEENEGESTSSQSSSGGSANAASASAAEVSYSTVASEVAASPTATEETPASTPSTTPTTTTPTTTPPSTGTKTKTTTSKTTTPSSSATTESKSSESTSTPADTGSSESTQSEATRDANLASARAAVKSDSLTLKSDEQAVENTKLRAPEDGTIVSLSGEVGQSVSASGTTKAAQSSSSSSSTGSTAGGGATTASSSEGSSSGSSTFMVLSNLNSMQLVVALSESEIGSVHAGQIATLTIEALNGRKVAAHVLSVGATPTSTSGAVSYDVTFQLDQGASGLKVGMSATAEVVIKQAEGVNVPTSAVKANSVTVLKNGRQETRQVTTGLAGDSATIVLGGLKADETVVLPSTSSAGSSSSGASSLGSKSSSRSGLAGAFSGTGGPPAGGGFPGGGAP